MLILSRKPGDRIHIGDDIVIEVKAVQGKIVRFGILAPSDVDIYRHEILPEDKQDDNAQIDTKEE